MSFAPPAAAVAHGPDRPSPEDFAVRIRRALHARFYVVRQSGPFAFLVRGDHSDHRWTVVVGSSCSCGRPHCVHSLFVLLRVLRVPQGDPVLQQGTLRDYEVDLMMQRYHERNLARKKRGAQPAEARPVAGTLARQPVDESECPICLMPMCDDESLLWCRHGCGHNVHMSCMSIWTEERRRHNEPETCPLCRKVSSFQPTVSSVVVAPTSVPLPSADPLSVEQADRAQPIISLFGDQLARCLFSRLSSTRLAAVTAAPNLLATKDAFRRTPDLALRGTTAVIELLLKERMSTIFLALLPLVTYLVDQTGSSTEFEAGLRTFVKSVVPALSDRTGDSNGRVCVRSGDLVAFMCQQPMIDSYLVMTSVVKGVVTATHPRRCLGRLQLLCRLLWQLRVDQRGIDVPALDAILTSAASVAQHPNGAVRRELCTLMAQTYLLSPDPVATTLHLLKPLQQKSVERNIRDLQARAEAMAESEALLSPQSKPTCDPFSDAPAASCCCPSSSSSSSSSSASSSSSRAATTTTTTATSTTATITTTSSTSTDPDPSCLPEWTIDYHSLSLDKRVGIGSFGEVFPARWVGGLRVAVKRLLVQDDEILDKFEKEIRVLARLRHPNVVLFLGACPKTPHLSIVTEFMDSSLFALIGDHAADPDSLPWAQRLSYLRDTACAMSYLHSVGVVHRDLKTANLLITGTTLKICDFGLSKIRDQVQVASNASVMGTPTSSAPEVLRSEPSNCRADVFSFGVIVWELETLRRPWKGQNPLQVAFGVAMQGKTLPIPENPRTGSMMEQCFRQSPDERPSFDRLSELLDELAL